MNGLMHHFEEFGRAVPYTMMQTCLSNKKEYKLVFLNRDFSHFAKNSSTGKAFVKTREQKDMVVRFAKEALHLLALKCPHAILDGLVRVDVMVTCRGEYVVNEIESLEANYWSNAGNGAERDDIRTHGFLNQYWLDKLHQLFAF